ncbi:TPA: hypothetical protein ACX1YF_004250 [Salmonella enterica subsp. enterica serovar Infantis]
MSNEECRINFMDEPGIVDEVERYASAIYYRDVLAYLQHKAEQFGWTLARTNAGDLRALPAEVRNMLVVALAVSRQVMLCYGAVHRNFPAMVEGARWDVQDGRSDAWLTDILAALAQQGIYPVKVLIDRPHDEVMVELYRADSLFALTMLAEIRSRPGDIDMSETGEYRVLLRQLKLAYGLDWEGFTESERVILDV